MKFTEELRSHAPNMMHDEIEEFVNQAADIIDELENALREVIAWKMAIDLVAPSLGGALASMYRAEAILAKLESLNRGN